MENANNKKEENSNVQKWKNIIEKYKDADYDINNDIKYPKLKEFRETGLLQEKGGYISNAITAGIINKKNQEEIKTISQKWHFFVSYLYMYKILNPLKKTAPEEYNRGINELKKCMPDKKIDQKAQIDYVIEELEKDNYSALNCEAFKNSFGIPSFQCSELILWMAEATNYDSGKLNELFQKEVNFREAEKTRTKDTFLNDLIGGLKK